MNKLSIINLQVIPMNSIKLLNRIIDYVNQFIKNVTNLGKKEYLYWIKIGCSLALKNDSKKAWKWVIKNAKINNQSFTVSHPIKNNNNELVSSKDEKLKAWYSHHKFLGLDSLGHSLSKDYWKDSDALRNFGSPRQQEWEPKYERWRN